MTSAGPLRLPAVSTGKATIWTRRRAGAAVGAPGPPSRSGIAAFRIANYVLWPFGRTIAPREGGMGIGAIIGNIIWAILFGWELALGHLVAGILLCITIIGIPLGLASFKIIPISLVPLGVQIVPADEPSPSYT